MHKINMKIIVENKFIKNVNIHLKSMKAESNKFPRKKCWFLNISINTCVRRFLQSPTHKQKDQLNICFFYSMF